MKWDASLSAAATIPPKANGIMVRVVEVEGEFEFIHANGVKGRGWGGEELKYPI